MGTLEVRTDPVSLAQALGLPPGYRVRAEMDDYGNAVSLLIQGPELPSEEEGVEYPRGRLTFPAGGRPQLVWSGPPAGRLALAVESER